MAPFFKFKFLITLILDLNGGQFYERILIKFWLFQKVKKSNDKIVNFTVK